MDISKSRPSTRVIAESDAPDFGVARQELPDDATAHLACGASHKNFHRRVTLPFGGSPRTRPNVLSLHLQSLRLLALGS